MEAVSLSGKKDSQTKTISVFDPAVISSFTVNGKRTVNIAPNTDLNFTWATTSAPTVTLNNTAVTGTSSALKSAGSAGNTNYVLKATNGANKSISDTVIVNVIDNPAISGITSPSNVFVNAPFAMSWAGSRITNYKLKSNNGNSGLPTSDTDYGTVTSTSITPTAAGNYTYTLTGTNEADATTSSTKSVIAEANPTFTGFTVNGAATVTLNFVGTGFSTGATLQGRNSTGTANVQLPTKASTTSGTTTYYAAAAKTINGVTNYSANKSVSVVVNALPVEECLYSASNKITSYVYGNSTITTSAAAISIKESAYDILWNGTYIYIDDYANIQLPYVSGGYKYTAGSLQKNPYYCWLGDEDGTCFEAQVCRTKI